MKTLFITILLAFSVNTIAQDLHVRKHVDDMTDEVHYIASKNLICASETKDIGFALEFNYEGKSDDTIKINGIFAKIVGMSCVENVTLLFLFDDGTKLKLQSYFEFNCDGSAWFRLNNSASKKLYTKTIKKIRLTNGRNSNSHTHTIEGDDKSYFIKMSDVSDVRAKQLK